MASVCFSYNSEETIILCNIQEKMRDIINRYRLKSQINDNKIQFLYDGKLINLNLTFLEQANQLDKERKIMNILVYRSSFSTVINEGKKNQKKSYALNAKKIV